MKKLAKSAENYPQLTIEKQGIRERGKVVKIMTDGWAKSGWQLETS